MSPHDPEMLLRRAERDRRAREQAERLLEEKTRELYDANERLRLATKGRLEALSRVGEDLSQLQDLDLLMNRILSEARALTSGRYHVSYEDIRAVAHSVLRHRVLTNFHAQSEGITSDSLIDKLLDAVPAPRSGM